MSGPNIVESLKISANEVLYRTFIAFARFTIGSAVCIAHTRASQSHVVELPFCGKALTKGALAKRAGLSRSMILMMESGDRHPTLVTFLALCVALGISPSELLGEIEQRD